MLDVNGIILDIIEKNPQCKFPKIIQEYRLALKVEEWQEDPFTEEEMMGRFIIQKRIVRSLNREYAITDLGKKFLCDQKKSQRNYCFIRNIETFLKFILIPITTTGALLVGIYVILNPP